MAPESYKRKLAAILSADVEGYSRLMGEDEDATLIKSVFCRFVLSPRKGRESKLTLRRLK